MSVIEQLKKKKKNQVGFMAAVGGQRLAGKSTIAGTLPGKTLVIQPAGIESGNTSPVGLAKKRGNVLDIIEFTDHNMIFEILNDKGLLEYDNIYIDGISAYTEMVYMSDEFVRRSDKNKWDGFDYIKDMATQLVTQAKVLADTKDKNVFITYALKPKYDENGDLASVEMDAKGNATKSLIEGKCPSVIAVVTATTEDGTMKRGIVTKHRGPYIGRLGNLLDEDNPGVLEADLGVLLKLVGRV